MWREEAWLCLFAQLVGDHHPGGVARTGWGGREVFKWSSQRRKSEYLEVLWKVCLPSFSQRQDFSNTLGLLPNTLELLQKEAFFMVI